MSLGRCLHLLPTARNLSHTVRQQLFFAFRFLFRDPLFRSPTFFYALHMQLALFLHSIEKFLCSIFFFRHPPPFRAFFLRFASDELFLVFYVPHLIVSAIHYIFGTRKNNQIYQSYVLVYQFEGELTLACFLA
jgi:hypothetical protein